MGLTLIAPASGLLVEIATAKLWAKADDTVGSIEDDWFTSKIAAATQQIEAFLGVSVSTKTWALSLPGFSDVMELPPGPIQSVASVEYLDSDGAEQTLSASLYALDLIGNPASIVRASDASWPATDDVPNAVTITFTAGFDDAEPVLADIKDAVLDIVAWWYDNRGEGGLPKWVKDRLRPYRLPVL